jgi:hypothetical protein
MKRPLLLLAISLGAMQARAQNDCANAVPVTLGTYTVSSVNGPQIPSPQCTSQGSASSAGEWYTFTATIDTAITVSTDLPVNAGGDTRFHVYTGSCGALTCYAGDDDNGSGYLSTSTFNVTSGTTYIIAFDNYWSSFGFDFIIQETAPAVILPGGFTAQTVSAPGMAYCVVDMNADGLDDAVDVSQTTIHINYQLSGGGFQPASIGTTAADYTPSWSMCAGDLDKNGYNDLVYAGSGITLMLANAGGTAYTETSFPQYIFCQRSNTVDINNDGHLDVFSCHDVAPNVYFLNDGNNTFGYNQGGLGDTPDGGNYGTIWVDYDNDRDVDMFIAKCRGANSPASIDQLHRNNGNGTFTDVAGTMNLQDFHQSWSSAWGDYDNDGDMDILIGTSSFSGGGHKLMRNDGNTFTNVTIGSGYDLFTGTSIEFVTHDFDNDGYLDVLGGGALMVNNGDMTFTQTLIDPNNGPIGDLNNDGFLDIQNGGTIWMNNANANNWLKVHTTGTLSNGNGIGARVEIYSAMGTQIRDVRSGDGFRYMSSLNTHFGIGTDTAIDSVIVRWPSGLVSKVDAPPINGTLDVVEDLSTGVATIAATELSLFPNPAINTLQLRSGQDLSTRTVIVNDLAGKEVIRTTVQGGSIQVDDLKSGMYLLRVMGDDRTIQGRFIKQ